MFFINWLVAIIAICVAILLGYHISYRAQEKHWGESMQGLRLE